MLYTSCLIKFVSNCRNFQEIRYFTIRVSNILSIVTLDDVIRSRGVALTSTPVPLEMPKFEQIDHGIDEKRKDIVLNIGNTPWKS